jgi:Putative  PD-(D/E)XK family member, (DUF4420)
LAADVAQSAIREAWAHLDAAAVRGKELVGRRPSFDPPVELLCAVSTLGSRYFLVPIADSEEELLDDTTRGLRVSTLRLEIAGETARRYVSVQCSDPGAYDLFDVVGGELLVAIVNSPNRPRDAAKFVINRWKRFWSDVPRSVMKDEDVAGLFGELWFIHVWLSACIGIPAAVKVWRGPFGSRHDFEGKHLSVEVKATTARSDRIHHINGIDQLAKPEGGPLLFFSLAIQLEGGATNSIVVLIDAIRALLHSDPDIADYFDRALSRLGYSDAFRSHYAERTFRVVNAFLFEVDGLFPRLTKTQLTAGELMPGVSKIEYNVDLGGIRAMALADRPDAASAVLRQLAG